jgi:uncharacterized protein YjbJ (UPF0337 family)
MNLRFAVELSEAHLLHCCGKEGPQPMNRDEIAGKTRNVTGKVKESVGRATNDDRLVDEGLDDQAAGKVQDEFGKARRKVGEAIKDVGEKIKR